MRKHGAIVSMYDMRWLDETVGESTMDWLDANAPQSVRDEVIGVAIDRSILAEHAFNLITEFERMCSEASIFERRHMKGGDARNFRHSLSLAEKATASLMALLIGEDGLSSREKRLLKRNLEIEIRAARDAGKLVDLRKS